MIVCKAGRYLRREPLLLARFGIGRDSDATARSSKECTLVRCTRGTTLWASLLSSKISYTIQKQNSNPRFHSSHKSSSSHSNNTTANTQNPCEPIAIGRQLFPVWPSLNVAQEGALGIQRFEARRQEHRYQKHLEVSVYCAPFAPTLLKVSPSDRERSRYTTKDNNHRNLGCVSDPVDLKLPRIWNELNNPSYF